MQSVGGELKFEARSSDFLQYPTLTTIWYRLSTWSANVLLTHFPLLTESSHLPSHSDSSQISRYDTVQDSEVLICGNQTQDLLSRAVKRIMAPFSSAWRDGAGNCSPPQVSWGWNLQAVLFYEETATSKCSHSWLAWQSISPPSPGCTGVT